MDFIDLLSYEFFRNALLGSLFASVACGIIGTYIVIRRLVFVSGGITHASMGGIGIGLYAGINPILAALLFSVFSAFGIEWLSSKQGIREDSAIATLWSLGMAIGIIFIYLTPGFAPNISDYLFGNILTVTKMDILLLAILSFVLIVVFVLFRREILYTAFDPDFARTRNLPVTFIKYVMMFFIAVTIVLSIRLVGIVLLLSILTVPQMTANLFTSNFNKMIGWSVLIGFAGCIAGLLLSVELDVPSGVFIIFTQILIFLVARIIVRLRQKGRQMKSL
ncbi:metal ABC transporter permease [Dysgonomonas sp. 25]|uniref:metal ABC transporter permease n=1 Tax=Dysgonomonas sp. 25 TaxID=2302933 RepID=UPI0013D29725|nr:metal ABC transporter permease [Dysgonomonas sp. 25]NDV69521.1 metal ABC transporter permease [Dysgonomonas sp. 25]